MPEQALVKKSLPEVIDLTQKRFEKMAPSSINFDKEKSFAIQLLINNDYLKKVAMGQPESLAQAITNIATIGLSLNPASKEAYLIPRTVKITVDGRQKYVSKIFLEPSYQGLCNLATSAGNIEWIQARCVYSNDEFIDYGPGVKPKHEYKAFDPIEKRGEFFGAFCIAKTNTGDYLTETMSAEDIYNIRDRSEAYKRYKEKNFTGHGGPWVTDFPEMAKKCPIRRGFKMWPKTERMARIEEAIQLSNENEGFEPLLTSPDIGKFTAEQKEYFDQLIEKSDAMGMFLFIDSIDENVYINLYHSFEKGSKGKYQKIVNTLQEDGRAQMHDCVEQINSSATHGDDSGITELIEGASQEFIDYVSKSASDEALEVIRNFVKKEES